MNHAPRSPHAATRRQFLTAALARRRAISADYHVLEFDVAGGMDARPGQFLMIRGADWGAAPLLARPMSYLDADGSVAILMRVVGEGTERMARATPGDTFHLLGPLGNWWEAALPARNAVLVAGGVGVAPLLFLARSLAARGSRPTVAYGGRTDRDLPLLDELEQVATVVVTTEDGSRGHRGRVTAVLEPLLGRDAQVFTCGPEPMMAKVAELCAARDVPCVASLESPMACGFGVCLGCAMPTTDGGYLYACAEGPCVDAHRIDWQRTARARQTSEVRGGCAS